jgi:hypothetical protein
MLRFSLGCSVMLALSVTACSSKNDDGADAEPKGPPTTTGETFEDAHDGVYHLGPVDFSESEWHNACAPQEGYRKELRTTAGLSGEYLAGVSGELSQNGGVCDACILIETGAGESIVARVVTYGQEQAPGDIDVSPSVYEAIHHGEFPRSMTWRFARCPDVGGLKYEFQTGANAFWTSLWVRNPRVPLTQVEVKSKSDSDFMPLQRGRDGTLTDAGGFGEGAFTLRMTGMDGQVIEEELPGFNPGQLIESELQFE